VLRLFRRVLRLFRVGFQTVLRDERDGRRGAWALRRWFWTVIRDVRETIPRVAITSADSRRMLSRIHPPCRSERRTRPDERKTRHASGEACLSFRKSIGGFRRERAALRLMRLDSRGARAVGWVVPRKIWGRLRTSGRRARILGSRDGCSGARPLSTDGDHAVHPIGQEAWNRVFSDRGIATGSNAPRPLMSCRPPADNRTHMPHSGPIPARWTNARSSAPR
jgi:hypothetical protein